LNQGTNSNNTNFSPKLGSSDDWINEAQALERSASENERAAEIEAGMQLAQMKLYKFANEAKKESNNNKEDEEEEKTTVGIESINVDDDDDDDDDNTSSISSSSIGFSWNITQRGNQSANIENETQNEERLNSGDNEEVQCQDTNDGRDGSQVWISKSLKPLRDNLLLKFDILDFYSRIEPYTPFDLI
jgi:hypothetical protein